MTRIQQTLTRLAPILFLVAIALVVAACIPGSNTGSPGASPSHSQAPLAPAVPGANPIDLLAWLFTPIFQVMFIIMVGVYEFLYNLGFPGAIAWGIVVQIGRAHV